MKDIVNDYTNEFEKILESTGVKSRSSKFSVCCFDPEETIIHRDRLQIAAIPTSKQQKEKLFNNCSWEDCIFQEVLRKCKRDAIPAFLKISRFIPKDIAILVGGVATAGGVGVGMGGVIGVGIGASIGAAGFGVGAIPGAVVGGAVGIASSVVLAIITKRYLQ